MRIAWSKAVQPAIIALAIPIYPLMLVSGLHGFLLAPVASGLLLAVASLLGPKPVCPVKIGFAPGLMGALAVAMLGLTPSSPIGYAAVLIYSIATPPAFGGAFVLAAWKVGISSRA